ncbi:hypothetical protein AAJCM20276_13530 [Acetobacter aceti]|uniref:Uncharacterized protein n=1 Tax=Acetobacter aceti TaxID=435 RepID=A0A6S6PHG2_ACEAC|nr:hypothetical protein AAJCM20276_13530 [Acetobacter aceti]
MPEPRIQQQGFIPLHHHTFHTRHSRSTPSGFDSASTLQSRGLKLYIPPEQAVLAERSLYGKRRIDLTQKPPPRGLSPASGRATRSIT